MSGATASRVTLANSLGVGATVGFTTWINPTNTSLGIDTLIFSNGGLGSAGWSLRQLANTGNLRWDLGTLIGYEASVMAKAPAAFYKFEETSGTVIADSSGNGRTGTLLSGAGLVYGVSGHDNKAFTFSGNNRISITPLSFPAGAFSISAWVQTPVPTNGAWKTLTRGTTTDHQLIFQQTTNEFGSYLNSSGGFTGSGVFVNNLSAGFHLFTVVGSASGISWYVDGYPTPTASTSSTSTGDIAFIGNYQGGSQPIGTADGVALWTRSLTAAEVLDLYTSSAGCQIPLKQGVWQNISGTFDGITASLYSNGAVGCTAVTSAANPSTGAAPTLGATAGGANAWPGQLGDFRVYGSLSAADVATNYAASKLRYLPNPSQISNLRFWVDAKDPNADGSVPVANSSVLFWRDKSLANNDLSISGIPPTYDLNGLGAGYPALHYAANGSHFSTVSLYSDYTIALVSRLSGLQNKRVLGDYVGGNILFGYWGGYQDGYYTNNNPQNLFAGGNYPLRNAATTNKNAYIFTRVGGGGAFAFYNRGVYSTGSTTSDSSAFKLQVGCGNGLGGECSDVYVSELVVYDRVLTAGELTELYSYLRDKWGF